MESIPVRQWGANQHTRRYRIEIKPLISCSSKQRCYLLLVLCYWCNWYTIIHPSINLSTVGGCYHPAGRGSPHHWFSFARIWMCAACCILRLSAVGITCVKHDWSTLLTITPIYTAYGLHNIKASIQQAKHKWIKKKKSMHIIRNWKRPLTQNINNYQQKSK